MIYYPPSGGLRRTKRFSGLDNVFSNFPDFCNALIKCIQINPGILQETFPYTYLITYHSDDVVIDFFRGTLKEFYETYSLYSGSISIETIET